MTTNSTLSKDYRILCKLGRNQYFDIILKVSSPKREMKMKKKKQQRIDLNCIDVLALIKHLYTFSFTLARSIFNARKIAFEFCKSLIMSENSKKKSKYYRTKGIN